MEIKLLIDNLGLHECDVLPPDSSLISLKPFESISSWLIEYYFTRISSEQSQPINIVGAYEMFNIYQLLEGSSMEFLQLCRKKLNQIENDGRLEKYNCYLRQCGLVDLIDVFHQCQVELVINTLMLSTKNIKNSIDRLFFEYFVRLPSSSCFLYDLKTKVSTAVSNENLVQLITQEKSVEEPMNSKVHIKRALCTCLSLLSDTRNEHALVHCLNTFSHIGIDRETILELRSLSKSESSTMYQILLSFIRREELSTNRMTSSHCDRTDKLTHLLEKYHVGLKEFLEFVEENHTIIEENESRNIKPIVVFRKVLESNTKQIFKDETSNQCNSLLPKVIEELCQCFETNPPTINRSFLPSLSYLCAKQTTDLPLSLANIDHIGSSPAENLSRRYKPEQCLDLSTIHETSFESDSSVNTEKVLSTATDPEISLPAAIKRQPLREIDVNSFDNQKRDTGKTFVLTLTSDGDKENIPMLTRKRSMSSTHNEPANKKPKKSNIKPSETGRQMTTGFFQSIN